MSQFSLTWNSYQANICSGLTSLQQNEEFVDMTLAADGHFVKVHQMIISLASPYLKDLIKSAPCPHPVIFLNNISYPILCSILEYVYSGEVRVHKQSLNDLLHAGRALHIKGLDEMVEKFADTYAEESTSPPVKAFTGSLVDKLQKYKTRTRNKKVTQEHVIIDNTSSRDLQVADDVNMADPFDDIGEGIAQDSEDDLNQDDLAQKSTEGHADILQEAISRSINTTTTESTSDTESKTVQYTLSNQGSLQLVLNRFVYYMRYCHKNSNPPIRLWRCVDYIKGRCPASVTTRDDIVVQRVAAHKHPFHDKKIVKKLKAGVIFTALKDAEVQGQATKKSLTEKGNNSLSERE